MFGEQKYLVAGVGIAALALLILIKKKGAAADVGAAIGGAAVDLAGGVVAGASEGIGDAIGVPRTDMTECEQAKAEGRKWDASKACSASDFLGYLWNGN